MAGRFTLDEVRTQTYKRRDAWWTVLLVDPLASRLVLVAARYPAITPNRLTMLATVLGAGSVACFAMQDYAWLVAGALLFHLSFVVDCMDGKIARLLGNGSAFGTWLDFVFDRLRVAACAVALMGGQYVRTGDLVYLWLASAVIFADMFRYLNAGQMAKVRKMMRWKLAAARGDDIRTRFVEDLMQQHPLGEVDVDELDEERPVVDVNGAFRSRFTAFVRLRNFLIQHRIRGHLFSGIEFEMFVFIVAPITAAVVPVTIASVLLLLVFEALLVLKLWMATRSFTEQLVRLRIKADLDDEAGPDGMDVPAIPSQRIGDGTVADAEDPLFAH
jgi:phosphatidylglycerophosphate synthase